MAISIKIGAEGENLFCESKWLGGPDLPPDADYPMVEAHEDGEVFDYPLTLICQINCEDIAELDPQGLLPHTGLLYFFATVEEARGYQSPVMLAPGQLTKGTYLVKYSKTINMETFETNTFLDEDEQPFAAPGLCVSFAPGESGAAVLLDGETEDGDVVVLKVGPEAGFQFTDAKYLRFIAKPSDLKYGNWKKIKVVLGN